MNDRDVIWYAMMAVASACGLWVGYETSNGFLAIMAAAVLAQGAYIYKLERQVQ